MDIWYDDLSEWTKQALRDYYGVSTDEELFEITHWDEQPVGYGDIPLDKRDTNIV